MAALLYAVIRLARYISTASNTAVMLFFERSSSMEPVMFHSSTPANIS